MSILKKLVAIAALAALAAPAFAYDVDLATNFADAAAAHDFAVAELGGTPTSTVDGNYAQIFQEASAGNAYIDQSGANNFASIVQSANDASTAVIFQVGDTNRAAIYQH